MRLGHWFLMALVAGWLAAHAVQNTSGSPKPAAKCGGVIDPSGICKP